MTLAGAITGQPYIELSDSTSTLDLSRLTSVSGADFVAKFGT